MRNRRLWLKAAEDGVSYTPKSDEGDKADTYDSIFERFSSRPTHSYAPLASS